MRHDGEQAPAPPDPVDGRLRAMVLGAIGVVYGDIGTSPLYTIKQTFGEHGVAPTTTNVLGVLSLVFWSLVLVVSVKYAGFIMRADNKGEGGIMALTALAQRSVRSSLRARWWIVVLGLFGAALFFGDGVITPAISVLGAVEGLEILAPRLEHWVVPLSALIIVALFAFQNRGTGRVGMVFAPVMVLWFVTLAVLGVWHVVQYPYVLRALSPWYAIEFFTSAHWGAFFALGSVILAITGAEALYADMGHFGKKPIRWSWFSFVLPSLLLNYFGQGALVIADPTAAQNPLFLMVPSVLLVPLLVLATACYAFADVLHAATNNALSAAISPAVGRGKYLSYWQYSFTFSSVLAPAFFAQLFEVRHELPWVALAVLALVASLTIYVLARVAPRLSSERI